MNDDEEYEEGEVEVVEVAYEPVWRWSWLDVPGIALNAAAGVLCSLGQGAAMMSTQFQAAANYRRQTHELKESQRLEAAGRAEIERSLQSMVNHPWPLEDS